MQEMRDAKMQRETQQFWSYQRRIVRSGPIPRDEMFWRRQERQIYGPDRSNSKGIDFDQYNDIPVERRGGRGDEPVVESFQQAIEAFDLPKEISENINRCGYTAPTPVQKHGMTAALFGSDVMVSAETGSGKTAAFLVPIITNTLHLNGERRAAAGGGAREA
jgi:hypothetical protein